MKLLEFEPWLKRVSWIVVLSLYPAQMVSVYPDAKSYQRNVPVLNSPNHLQQDIDGNTSQISNNITPLLDTFSDAQVIMMGQVQERLLAARRLGQLSQMDSEEQCVAILALTWALRDADKQVSRAAAQSLLNWIDRIEAPNGLGIPVLEALVTLTGRVISRDLLDALDQKNIQQIVVDLGLTASEKAVRFLYREIRALEFLSDYTPDPSLARELQVVFAIKDRDQKKRNHEAAIRAQGRVTRGTFLGSDRPRRYRQGGLVAAFSLAADVLDEEDNLWQLPGTLKEPYDVTFWDNRMVAVAGEEVRVYSRSGQRAIYTADWLKNIHTVQFSQDGRNLLLSSPAFDLIMEMDSQSGLVIRQWSLWNDGGFNRSPAMGHYLTRSPEMARHWQFQNEPLMLAKSSDPDWPDTGIPVYRRVGLNGVSYLGSDQVGFTVLHTGTAHILDLKSDQMKTALYGLWDPHGFEKHPGGYHYADTARGGFGMIREDLMLARYIDLRTMPGAKREPQAGEWLQMVSYLGESLYVLVDIHRSTVWLVDVAKRTYRGVSIPESWAVQSVVNLPSSWDMLQEIWLERRCFSSL